MDLFNPDFFEHKSDFLFDIADSGGHSCYGIAGGCPNTLQAIHTRWDLLLCLEEVGNIASHTAPPCTWPSWTC